MGIAPTMATPSSIFSLSFPNDLLAALCNPAYTHDDIDDALYYLLRIRDLSLDIYRALCALIPADLVPPRDRGSRLAGAPPIPHHLLDRFTTSFSRIQAQNEMMMKEFVLLRQLDSGLLSGLKLAYNTTRRQVDMDLVKGWMRDGGAKYGRVDEQLVEVWALLEEAGMAEWVRVFIAGDLYEPSNEEDHHSEDDYDHDHEEDNYRGDDYDDGGDNSSIDQQQIGLETMVGAGAAGGGLRRRTQSQRRQLDTAPIRGDMYI